MRVGASATRLEIRYAWGRIKAKRYFKVLLTHIYKTNKSAVYCMASHQFIKGRWESE